MSGKHVEESKITLSQVMNVTDANTLGNVHGGILMKLADEAGGIAAARHAGRPVVTVTIDSMTFHSPVHIGDLVQISAEVTWTGRTSIETRVAITAEDVIEGTINTTNRAFIVYVALDKYGRPTPVPSLICETEEEKRRFKEGAERQAYRLKERQ